MSVSVQPYTPTEKSVGAFHTSTVQRFRISDKFLEEYKDRKPDWGPLGEFVFYRTYSRKIGDRNEAWWETVRRVVEGTFTLQKQHCASLKLPWNNQKAQRSAQKMYDKIFNFKFLPPGRGLWMMGTDYVYERGGTALNNCAYVSTEDIKYKGSTPFRFTMDALMHGTGVGFDTTGAGQIVVKEPKKESDTFIIPDTREGWVEATGLVIDAYFYGQPLPHFDYSYIRPYGEPIKGFGGVASGPEPLITLHESLVKFFTERIGQPLKSTDIVDIENMIGKCVVAGNVRRSAEIALGPKDDTDYREMKDPEKFGDELMDRRWASNNSIYAEVGMNYRSVVDQIAKNGEPGLVWLKNMQEYGRIADNGSGPKDYGVRGTNPCFVGDTLVAVADGRGAVSLRELAEDGKDVPVYSVNPEGKVEIKMGRNPRVTGYDQELVRVYLDHGEPIVCTPDHEFLLVDGTRVKANDLQEGHSLSAFQKTHDVVKKGGNKYLQVKTDVTDPNHSQFEHRLVSQFHDSETWDVLYEEAKKSGWIDGGLVVHHKDFDPKNNRPENLEVMTFEQHRRVHNDLAGGVSGHDNPMFGRVHSENTKKMIGVKTKDRVKDVAYRERWRKSIAAVVTDATRDNMRRVREEEMQRFYKEFEATTDLETRWIGNQLMVVRYCETCGQEMLLPVGQRERSFCSRGCMNRSPNHIAKRKAGQKVAFENNQRQTLHNQIMVFKDLQDSLGRDPFAKEWQVECKDRGVAHRIRHGRTTENPYAIKFFSQLKEMAGSYNHRVRSVERLSRRENVYNITVDDNHTFAVVNRFDTDSKTCSGVFVENCGEQSLESYEMCCLVETFPSLHESYEEYQETLKYAYLYAKTVTLVPSNWPEVNQIQLKNRRIGTSQSGIIDAFVKHGRREVLNWSDKGYKYLRELDKAYSDWLCIPQSIKITSVKPSGTVSNLPGVSPGIHYPHSEYYIRRVRVAETSPLLHILKDAGYPIEPDAYGSKMQVVSFPVWIEHFSRRKEDVTAWEQVVNAVDYQTYWCDNNVSITVTFKHDEKEDLVQLLEAFEDRLKAVSFLPLSEHGYTQAPYEEITQEQYEEMVAKIVQPDYSQLSIEADGGKNKFCDSETCDVNL